MEQTTEWEDELRSLQHILSSEIKERLKLVMTCMFLVGQNRDSGIRIWDWSGWNGRLGLQNLENKNLVEPNNSNEMHIHGQRYR